MSATTRRTFLCNSCGAWTAFCLGALPGSLARRAAAADDALAEPVLERPFGRVERLAEGVFAVVANMAGGSQLVSNGGIVAGRDAVLMIEAHMTPEGAAFAREAAVALTGRAPTHVVLTHFHGDHVAGLPAYARAAEPTRIVATRTTRDLMIERSDRDRAAGRAGTPEAELLVGAPAILPDALLGREDGPTEIDLGGRVVRLVPRSGHTGSDVTIELDDPPIRWCGDLVFNGLFPFYGDATPSRLATSVRALLADGAGIRYVPGHGPIAAGAGLAPYVALLEDVASAARDAFAAGRSIDEAWRGYAVPASLGDWAKFRPDVYRFAFEAWARELGAG